PDRADEAAAATVVVQERDAERSYRGSRRATQIGAVEDTHPLACPEMRAMEHERLPLHDPDSRCRGGRPCGWDQDDPKQEADDADLQPHLSRVAPRAGRRTYSR